MIALVTGAAGFIGSTLTEALLRDGHTVRAVDCLTDYYDLAAKQRNLDGFRDDANALILDLDLRSADLTGVLDGVDLVFHQAGQPGVRLSWSSGFDTYASHNVLATQRLLEACRNTSIRRFVYASSSSVYGNAVAYPSTETDLPQPHSPYGVTKLAGEHLCRLYAANWGLPTVSLRYFTVYGPRQRPDMALHRLIRSMLTGEPFPLYGDGSQVRDFTFVDDIVRANVAAAEQDLEPGGVINVAGGSSCTVRQLIDLTAEKAGVIPLINQLPSQPGDVFQTGGSIERASRLLGWHPQVTLAEGVLAEVDWLKGVLAPLGPQSTESSHR